MSNPLDVRRNLDHCMQNIKGAGEAMAEDMHEAAMRLGAAEMMLASASYAVRKRAGQPALGTGATRRRRRPGHRRLINNPPAIRPQESPSSPYFL